jgi:hypothetical protein
MRPRIGGGVRVTIVVVACLLALCVTAAVAGDPAYSPKSRAYGKTLGQWGAEWWLWMGQFPLADSPITDATGSRGGADYQPGGPVWYLAGTFGGPAERSVQVPTDTSLLFPIINWDVWSPEDCWWMEASEEPDPCSAADLQAFLDDFFMNHVTGMSVTLDGEEIRDLFSRRAISGPFTLPIPPNSLWTSVGYAEGDRYPNLSDGYYVLLKPLEPGNHVLTFSAEVDNNPGQEVTYHLTVVEDENQQ